ncbi:cell cycle checkpoint protein RAD17 [Toxorhynchites rutilus septentrionalis]|uniref:cell cycle checkpoint protein RAD17 n=1 Tax=Toxorhynchites rutilus septentrionalis TaxID=329112 RepID=UPI0024792EAF|nr:cell cycle checkpoint protein RAD17 [Toxorhynchites rutilus septentrionalis]XP_055634289.1 cell cycle checkpoint protein RAD17 [Toxorhynchites rutilus septentrionalis]
MKSNKTKRWFSSAFDVEPPTVTRSHSALLTSVSEQLPASKKTKLTKTSSFSHVERNRTTAAPTSEQARQTDWSVDFEPKSVAELAVHAKKIEEIQQWFKTYDRVKDTDPVAILLVSGPSGTGKSTTIRTIARELNYEVCEWTSPVDVDLFSNENYDFENGAKEEVTYRAGQQQLFDEFLYKTSRYCSIFEAQSSGKLLLVKDFPNVFLRNPESFQRSLETYWEVGASPLVFIATETSNKRLDIVYNLFPPAVVQDFQIAQVSFNSVSGTLLKKAVKRLCSLLVSSDRAQQYRVPAQETIDSIILSSQGDLRNAMLNVHFASLKDVPGLATEIVNGAGQALNTTGTVSSGRGKKREHKLKSVGCNESLTLMHALGRVFNPKFNVMEDGSKKFHHAPEELTDAFISQPSSMISLIHSNYVMRFTDIDDIIGAADALSLADVIMSEYREDQLAGHGLNVVVRGMMINNRKTASGWQQIQKKKSYNKPSPRCNEQQLEKFGLKTCSISAGLFMTDFKTYLDIIQESKKP